MMKKLCSLLKATMSSDMLLFKINLKNKSKLFRILIVFFLVIVLFSSIYGYADLFMQSFSKVHMEYGLIVLFIVFSFILTVTEGIYKSSSLLFNCKDDNLLLSLPIKKSTVLFIRILKFYIFELLFNSLLLAPVLVLYPRYVSVGFTYYISSIIALFIIPIIPIIISSLIGSIISATSSKFKYKNIVETILIMVMLLIVLYLSFNIQTVIQNLTNNVGSITDLIMKIYYPAKVFVNLITNFKIIDLLLFIIIPIIIFMISLLIISKYYFRINSKTKEVKITSNNTSYKFNKNNKINSLIKKEFNRFINSPVFISNAAFGLVLYVAISVLICIKFDSFAAMIIDNNIVPSINILKSYIPIITFALICFTSLTSSITSSMISLEGKSFIILKSLPINPFTIIISKVLTAIIVMVPFILVGDIILFVKLEYSILDIIILLISSIVLPFVSELIGIIINLKYPKMDAENDSDVVKQSMSSMVAVLSGMFLIILTIGSLILLVKMNVNLSLVLIIELIVYIVIFGLLTIYLNKKGIKDFNKIMV